MRLTESKDPDGVSRSAESNTFSNHHFQAGHLLKTGSHLTVYTIVAMIEGEQA